MTRLAVHLDARRPDDVEELPLLGMPAELRPFISSINRLLTRIRVLIEQQRRFIADAAHELRTPITALSVQVENFRRTELPPASQERAAALQEGARRIAHLLEQLLALARYDMARIQDAPLTSLDQCAKQVVSDLLTEASARNVDLGFTRIETALVRSEPVLLTIMIRNLIDNAIRHSPDGSRVDVALYCEDGWVMLCIEDSGPGISPDDLLRIFEPFFRGSHPGSDGTGLGLSIVKRIVDALGGVIKLENINVSGRSGLRAFVKLRTGFES
jgi:two-component system OmpR family sensor kinase